ncbi:CCA tRNA nucleotidyltransferase [Lacticaseibacillus jixiensis]|uniref:CCA tRNA nucleotidyltransferase n=1 Tax=Lacticaseibacillus jixiensis TaxID=3231926 RepID=UPI0036F1D396
MHIDLTHPDFQAAIPILQAIEAAGFEAYFVGGCVRDSLLGLPIHDVDIASSAYPSEIKQIFNKTVDTGIQHGTVMVLDHGIGYEVTTFRTESTYQDFRRPDHVTFVRSLEEDLKRRDFTVNALAARHDGSLVDLFGGEDDLRQHVLKAVGNAHDRFHEDALRMMRAVRFQSQLGFTIEAATQQAIVANAPLLAHISIERIATEFVKLLAGIKRQAGLATFIDTGLYRYVPQFPQHEPGLRQLAALPQTQLDDEAVAWTLVCACLQLDVGQTMKAWKQSNALKTTVQAAISLLASLPDADAWTLYQTGQTAVQVAVAALAYLDPAADGDAILAAYAALPIKRSNELAVNGQTLMAHGIKPGRAMGQALHRLELAVVNGTLANSQAALLAALA